MVEKLLGKRFEDFVAALFRAEGFDVDQERMEHEAAKPDLLIHSKKGSKAVVEVKLYTKPDLKRLQREAKFVSPSGNCQSACRWSGRMQTAIVSNGKRSCIAP